MSDTPRTDKQAGYPDGSGCWKYTELGLYVDADFARQLERENARLLYGLKFASHFLENATSYIGAINDHDMPKAIYALDAVRFALSEINSDKKP